MMEQTAAKSRRSASSGAFTANRVVNLFGIILCVAYFFAVSLSNSHLKSTDTENAGTLEIVPYFGFDDYITFLFMNKYLLSSANSAGMRINIKKDQTANFIFILRKNAVVSCKLSKAVSSEVMYSDGNVPLRGCKHGDNCFLTVFSDGDSNVSSILIIVSMNSQKLTRDNITCAEGLIDAAVLKLSGKG